MKKYKKPKIGVIGLKGFPAFGGSARAGENMISLLKHEFDFVVYNVSSHTDRTTGVYSGVRQIVFKTFPLKSLNTFFYYLKSTFHALFLSSYNIVHVFHIDAAFIIPLLKIRYKVVAGHRARPQEFSKWNRFVKIYFNFMEWIFYKLPAHILTSVSKSIVEDYQNYTKRKIRYIPNGILLDNIPKKLPDVPYKDYILFASGRVIETKGCHFMLEALDKLEYKGKILVAGNLDHSPKYKNYLLGFKQRLDVEFLGLIKDKTYLLGLFKQAKLSIYPSMHEGMSNTLLELSSVKTPVICSDIPENKNVFNSDEVTFFRSGDVEDLYLQISYALSHSKQMGLKAEKAYNRLEQEYNWNVLSGIYSQLYKELLIQKL